MNISEIKVAVKRLLKKPQVSVPYIHGKPGVGKSDIIRQIAKSMDISFIDLRLSQLESCDTRGIPKANPETGSCRWYPPEMLPFEAFSKLPVPGKENKGKLFKDGGILFLDEINRAKYDVMQSVFELVLDRRVGLHTLLDNWFLVAAGNLGESDHTEITEITDAALNDRFIHFFVDDAGIFDCWKKWAQNEGNINHDVVDFLETKPSNIYTDPKEDSVVFATPRSWEKMSLLFDQNDDIEPTQVVDMFGPGLIGPVAVSFRDYLVTKSKITPTDILNNYPKVKAKIKKLERGKIYSLSNEMVNYIKNSKKMTDKNLKNMHDFLTNDVDKDHMVAVFKVLVDVNIKYKGKLEKYDGKTCELMDPYLDLFYEMNTTISDILKKSKETK